MDDLFFKYQELSRKERGIAGNPKAQNILKLAIKNVHI